jgi:hypothetical protein
MHEVAVHGWKEGVDDLFEVIIEFGLSFLSVGANAILNEYGCT